ncbi:uncharacterized protein METZ01_LOCUS266387 [marine metagenome]|uniref:Uncharacterized protein n=1 Tax=marine metagenome TaxID=408172 RepID=A0A382JQQ9_9ZZZZ
MFTTHHKGLNLPITKIKRPPKGRQSNHP